jgi:hypothetical protein
MLIRCFGANSIWGIVNYSVGHRVPRYVSRGRLDGYPSGLGLLG